VSGSVQARRSLRTPGQALNESRKRTRAEPLTRQAFLAADFSGTVTTTAIQFTDPTYVRSNIVRATVRAGLTLTPLTKGTPVTVQVRHGQVEIISLPAGFTPPDTSGTGGTGGAPDTVDYLVGTADSDLLRPSMPRTRAPPMPGRFPRQRRIQTQPTRRTSRPVTRTLPTRPLPSFPRSLSRWMRR
jgi:hypothetical protein